jgi:trehalose 6-phosphate synthase/phosphatase
MSNLDLEIMEGNKVLEIKNAGVNKGRGVANWLGVEYDFILAIGDDGTDEETFRIMPEDAYTIKVGLSDISSARYNFRYPSEVRDLLADFMNRDYQNQLTTAANSFSN